jgi:hypothetical protein
MSTRAADDVETIGRRLAELREESKRQLSCTCRPSDDGGRTETADCPIHAGALPAAAGLRAFWPPSEHLSDDWDAMREQARQYLTAGHRK